MTRERARELRSLIEQAAASLDDADARKGIELFALWAPEQDYVKNSGFAGRERSTA